MSVHGDLAGGAAQRRRDPRLRSWLRHELLAVTCWCLFVLEEYSYVDFLGDDFRIHRIQRFLVRQWIHVTASLRSLWVMFSVYSAKLRPQ